MRSETKIFNLDFHEFGSNLPFKKTLLPFPFCTATLAGTEVLLKINLREMSHYFLAGTGALK